MDTIHISASQSYDILIGRGLLGKVGTLLRERTAPCTAVIVTDDTVYSLYGRALEQTLLASGFRVTDFIFAHGERNKTVDTYRNALNVMSRAHMTRSDLVLALGGGVVGDLAGFAAATYQRGIRYVQIPTTLLAMVDSSVGGKTAVNLDAGKNQAGCFHQPSLVVCDPVLLGTLTKEEYLCGCAEVIKYGVLGDERFFDSLRTPVSEQYEAVIRACVSMKRDFVAMDEYDLGKRRMLNLGHTIAHAVEKCSMYSILHGQAVAVGMATVMRAAAAKGVCAQSESERLHTMLLAYGLPERTDYAPEKLYQAALADKKLSGGMLQLIVPERIGCCRMEEIPVQELREWMRAGGIA